MIVMYFICKSLCELAVSQALMFSLETRKWSMFKRNCKAKILFRAQIQYVDCHLPQLVSPLGVIGINASFVI